MQAPSSAQTIAGSTMNFAYPFRALDLRLHPAFINANMQNTPAGVLALRPANSFGQLLHCGANTLNSLNGNQPGATKSNQLVAVSPKSKSFTIDAILGRENSNNNVGQNLKDRAFEENMPTNDMLFRRHQRLDGQHPYLPPFTCASTFAYRSVQATLTKEKGDKKHLGGSDWKQSKSKRVRTIFTPEQLERLEAEFERQQYMVGTERYYLAASLNLTEAQVKVWFQNRRIKWRKQNLEQQQAKLAKLELFSHEGSESESESENEDEDDRRSPSPS